MKQYSDQEQGVGRSGYDSGLLETLEADGTMILPSVSINESWVFVQGFVETLRAELGFVLAGGMGLGE